MVQKEYKVFMAYMRALNLQDSSILPAALSPNPKRLAYARPSLENWS